MKEQPRILITGFGLVTPLGAGAWETFAALLAGRTIADRAAALPPDIGSVELVRAVGAVSIAQHTATDPSVELAERAAREALTMAGVSPVGLPCVIGTSKGAVHAFTRGIDALRRSAEAPPGRVRATGHKNGTSPTLSQNADHPDSRLAIALGPQGYLTHHLRQRLGLGLTHHLVTACASGLTALHHARLALLREPLAASRSPGFSRILVLTADAALSPMFIHAYRRLGVLAPLTPSAYQGRPLNKDRQGFMIAEAGAAIVLERVDDPQAPLPPHAVELIDSAEACDAYDLIRPCPDMPALRWLAAKLLRDRTIDLIHPHATGTLDHDAAELAVYLPLAASHPPAPLDLYAHKGALGHTLGASGLVSLVIACLCARTQRRPPMPWLTSPIEPSIRAAPMSMQSIRTQAVFAAGFGGHAAGAVIRGGG